MDYGTPAIVFSLMIVSLELVKHCQGLNTQVVSCGSVMKLVNVAYKMRLHSHDVKYGSGSGQQSVTATEVKEDVNSHWVVMGTKTKPCQRGEPVECGSIIRLQHLTTKRNLHSHYFSSPLSSHQEVSAFGENGDGDSGDHWTVVCEGSYWPRDADIMLRHVDTEMYLGASGQTFGRPIHGQMEVCAMSTPGTPETSWRTSEGLFILPSNFEPRAQGGRRYGNEHEHDEL